MTDHKFTDEEIVKALECCAKLDFSFEECEKCPYKSGCGAKNNMPEDALALINRQKNALEREIYNGLKADEEIEHLKMHYENAKAEAIKEFAERLKQKGMPVTGGKGFEGVNVFASNILIDTLVKEMTEENKCEGISRISKEKWE